MLKGYGNQIAQQVPTAFWDVLAQVIAKVAPETPTVQILSAEAHVPWELAVLPPTIPLANADTPPYLGAQVDIGRWVLGNPPPRVPPPGSLRIATIAAISGVYAGAANLEQAAGGGRGARDHLPRRAGLRERRAGARVPRPQPGVRRRPFRASTATTARPRRAAGP